MKFRLIYDGDLLATQGAAKANQRDRRAVYRHGIRQNFHGQLKYLWKTDRFLSKHRQSRRSYHPPRTIADEGSYWGGNDEDLAPLAEVVADQHRIGGYRFVPLVRADWSLLCSIHVLFLRRDFPGSVIQAGDIDNRMKTIIDALRMPRHLNELAGNESPADGEDPFFVLMEDDNLVSHFTVEADTLLEPSTGDLTNQRRAHLVITVDIRPFYVTTFNLSFS